MLVLKRDDAYHNFKTLHPAAVEAVEKALAAINPSDGLPFPEAARLAFSDLPPEEAFVLILQYGEHNSATQIDHRVDGVAHFCVKHARMAYARHLATLRPLALGLRQDDVYRHLKSVFPVEVEAIEAWLRNARETDPDCVPVEAWVELLDRKSYEPEFKVALQFKANYGAFAIGQGFGAHGVGVRLKQILFTVRDSMKDAKRLATPPACPQSPA